MFQLRIRKSTCFLLSKHNRPLWMKAGTLRHRIQPVFPRYQIWDHCWSDTIESYFGAWGYGGISLSMGGNSQACCHANTQLAYLEVPEGVRLHAGSGPEKPTKRNANQPSTYLELHRDKTCPGMGDQSILYLSMAENSIGLSRFRNSQDQRVIIKKNHTIWLCVEN